MEKIRIQKELTINTNIEKVYDFLTDPSKIPLVMPNLIENREIPELPLVVGSKFVYSYQMHGVVLEGNWVVTEVSAPNEGRASYKATTDGDIETEWSYTLAAQDGSTSVSLEIVYDVPERVLAKFSTEIAAKINDRTADVYLDHLKLYLES